MQLPTPGKETAKKNCTSVQWLTHAVWSCSRRKQLKYSTQLRCLISCINFTSRTMSCHFCTQHSNTPIQLIFLDIRFKK